MHIDTTRRILHIDGLAELIAEARDSARFTEKMSAGYAPRNGEPTAELAMRGCDASAARAAALIDQFADEIATVTWADEATVAGCYPVVAEFLAGEPECMRLPSLVASDAAPLSVYVDITSSWTVEPDALERRGAAIMALVQALSAHRPVTLQIGMLAQFKGEYGKTSGVRVCINTSPLDVASTAFAMSDASFARRIMYGAAHKHDFYFSPFPDFVMSCRRDLHGEECKAAFAEALGLAGDVLIVPPILDDDKLAADPVAWLKTTLAKYAQRQQF